MELARAVQVFRRIPPQLTFDFHHTTAWLLLSLSFFVLRLLPIAVSKLVSGSASHHVVGLDGARTEGRSVGVEPEVLRR